MTTRAVAARFETRRLAAPGLMLLSLMLAPVFAGIAEAASLPGKVVDEAGAPVPDAAVDVRFDDAAPGPAVRTGEAGSFVVPVDRPGLLRVRRLGYRPYQAAFSLADTLLGITVRLVPAPPILPDIEVTALRRPGSSADLTVPVERLDAGALRDFRASLPTLASRLRDTPEVTTIGRDEFNAAPAVRGLARFRTVLFVDGVRIHSDREIGPTAGFLDPASLGSAEVVRGPGSVLYGSDAIGGVILLRTESEEGGSWVEGTWSSANRSFRSAGSASAAAGRARIRVGAAHAGAGDYALPGAAWPWSAGARAENSGFSRSNARARLDWRSVEASLLYARGRDIGRPSREAEHFSVPSESHVLASARWKPRWGATRLEMAGYVHPTRWEAFVREPRGGGRREQRREYRSDDWGGLATVSGGGERASWVAGVQTDARSGVVIHRRLFDYDAAGVLTNEQLDRWVDGVSVGQAGAFAHALARRGPVRVNAGARLDAAWRAGSARDVRRFVPAGQAGIARTIGGAVTASLNAATAFREPTVTELFFAGRRPAGYIEGNPDLRPERSYQLDAGVTAPLGEWTLAASGFAISITDYIGLATRAPGTGGAVDTLLFRNRSRALLTGGSIEARRRTPWRGVTGRVFVDLVRGSDDIGAPLDDLHGPRARVEAAWEGRRVAAGLGWRGSLPHRRVGAAERPTAGYGVLDTGASMTFGGVRLGVAVQNVLDQEYYERGDPVGYAAPGRSVFLSLRLRPGA